MAAVADPRGADDGGAGIDLDARADVHGTVDAGAVVPVDARVQADPQAFVDLDAGHGHVGHFAQQDALQHLPVILDGADVDPVELPGLAVKGHALLGQQREQLRADVERPVRRDQVDHFGLEDVDARADAVRLGYFRRRLFLELGDASVCVADDDAVARHLVQRDFARDDGGQRALAAMFEQGRLQVQVDQCVAAEHDRRLVEEAAELLDLLHAAGRAQGLGHDFAVVVRVALEGIADLDTELVAFAEIFLDLFMQVADVDHDFGHAIARQVFDQVGHYGLAQDRDHWLGKFVSQWPYTRAFAGCEDHCFHR